MLPDSAGNAVVLLAQISQQLNGFSNGTHVPITASFSPQSGAPQSSPPASAVWVNSLWFLSLVISLFCALLATLQQRWARLYLQLTQPQVAIHKRARIRSFFYNGVTRFQVAITVEAIPALLHVSVFLFMTGLVISLFTIHHTVAYVVLAATAVCFLVYTAITVLPVIYYDSPYTSPFSASLWYIPRKTALAVLNTVDRMLDFYMRFVVCNRKSRTTAAPCVYRGPLSQDMTEAAHAEAARANSLLDAQALGWTLDRLDEEGELVKFAAGIPGFAHSTEVKDSAAILEKIPSKLHSDLPRHITLLLIRASKPGLMRDSKLLSESVRKQRVTICLEALYYLPRGIKMILRRFADNYRNPKVEAGFSPIFQSTESWLIAERLSVPNNRVDQCVTIGAQCIATVIASQPPNKHTQPNLMQHLKIKEPQIFNSYLEPFDSALLKNLNQFLENTALEFIDMEDIDIIVWTIRLVKRLKFRHAAQKLQNEFQTLLDKIYQHERRPLGRTSTNAKRLLDELIGPNRPVASHSSAHGKRSSPSGPLKFNAPGTAATSRSASTPKSAQPLSMRRPLLLVPQRSDDTCISIYSPTFLMSPNDTLPSIPMSTSL